MPELEHFCTFEGDLGMKVIGKTPGGMRIDFPFEGTATGPHWEGERPVRGVDYATVRGDGNMDLDIRAVIGEKREARRLDSQPRQLGRPKGADHVSDRQRGSRLAQQRDRRRLRSRRSRKAEPGVLSGQAVGRQEGGLPSHQTL